MIKFNHDFIFSILMFLLAHLFAGFLLVQVFNLIIPKLLCFLPLMNEVKKILRTYLSIALDLNAH